MDRISACKYDVIVVGAGAAGIPAAIAAAREGANVLIVEEDAVIGGAISDYFVTFLCGGPLSGIMGEVFDELFANHNLTPEQPMENTSHTFYLPQDYQRIFLRKMTGLPGGITIVCGARVTDAVVEYRDGVNTVVGIEVMTLSGRLIRVLAAVTIDATGNGFIAVSAGAEARYGTDSKSDFSEPHAMEKGDNQVQDCTWMYFSQSRPGTPAFDMTQLDHVKLGVLVNGLGWFHSNRDKVMERNPGIFLHWGCRVNCKNTLDPTELANAQQEALAEMERDHALLRENNYTVHLAPRIGLREGNRIIGDYILTENDLRSGILPKDTIALGNHNLDTWKDDDGLIHAKESHVPCFGIPYRCLTPKGIGGLLCAGRAISGSHLAMSAYRVMPTAGTMGQAAGIAAAICAKRKIQTREIDIKLLQKRLQSQDHNVKLTVE